jgi:hypothetical protein
VDDPAFFLSPSGKTDPAAELAATLAAIHAPPDPDDPESHAACRFPLRTAWLAERLGLSDTLPDPGCSEFRRTVDAIRPASATMVFPTYHINNPASMFGHTLLTVSSEGGTPLSAHAINYSARTGETSGPFFAVKGLLGMYPGYYSAMPYDRKIREYGDIDRRDIWEYPLNLDRAEIERMLMHLWELREIYADYYFFDENCAYNLLFLLEAARPSLRLVDGFSFFVLPADTLKAVRSQGLIDAAAYRPSRLARIRHGLRRLSPTGRRAVLSLAEDERAPEDLSAEFPERSERARILEMTAAYLQYRFARRELTLPRYRESLLAALAARSRLGRDEASAEAIPPPLRPDETRGTRRFWTGVGVRDGAVFAEAGWRPLLGDLIDLDIAPDHGMAIEFLSTRLRYEPERNRVGLERLDLIDIVSLSPRDPFFDPISWKLSTGFFRKARPGSDRATVFHLAAGAGWTHRLDGVGSVYALLYPRLLLGGGLPENHALGLGVVGGILREIRPGWKAHLSGGSRYYPVGYEHGVLEISLDQNFRITRDNSLNLSFSREWSDGETTSEAAIRWYHFF